MRRFLPPSLAGLAAALCGCAAVPRAPAGSSAGASADARPYVVLVSFDGFRADYLDRPLPLPAFRRLAAAGVRARAMVPSFPSKTFPNHLTLVTGLVPGHHGIVANTFWDPVRGATFSLRDRAAANDGSWYGGEPIWVTAERQGVRTATAMWPGSEAAIGGVRPSTWMPYDEAVPNAARVDSVAAWLRRPAATRPRLVTMYVATVDKAGHEHGPAAAATDSAIVDADRVLGRLLDSLAASSVASQVDLVVVADHGMMRISADRVVDLSRWVALDGVRTGDVGPVLSLWFGADSARREAAYAALTAGLAASGGHARVYRRAESLARWQLRDTPRAGDLVVAASPGWFVTTSPPAPDMTGGSHGWDPVETPEMGAIFLAAGPDVRARGVIDPFSNVDVYPLLAALLRVRPAPHLDGGDALTRSILR